MDPIYLDYNATTPLDPLVSEAIRPFLEGIYGNPSSSHTYGNRVARSVITARNQVASLLNCHPDEVVFTGGGTESNNFAIKGTAYGYRKQGNHIITTVIEHPAVTEVCRFLEEEGWQVTFVGVDRYGIVNPEEIRAAIRPDTVLVTVMHANNETGSIQPIHEIGRITRETGTLFHTDAAQSIGKIPVDVRELGVDLLSLAGHKCYAPQGIGALYIRRGVTLTKLLHGANHETDRRAGTENVIGIVGLGKAAEVIGSWQPAAGSGHSPLHDATSAPWHRLQALRDQLFDGVRRELPEVRLNGHPEIRLPNTVSLGFPEVEANLLLQAMRGVAASAGAACHAGQEGVSGVLSAMQVPLEYAMGTIRFSVGRMTTEKDIRRAVPIIVNAYKEIRKSGIGIRIQNDGLGEQGNQVTGEQSHRNTMSAISTSSLKNRITSIPPHHITGIRLTDYTHALGCACKIRPEVLEEVLRKLPGVTDPRVMVGPEHADDAVVYRLNDRQALVQTVDVIPPVVDDPYTFGMIAAANALSDIYAMGGRPLFALNIVGFPESRLPLEVLYLIQEGASAKAAEAGIQIVGGHSMELTEPLFGLTVTGLVDPNHVVRNQGLVAGDSLILTKPLGTGILTTALKRDLLDQERSQALFDSMSALNNTAAGKMKAFAVHACTDVTGFGLLGHLREMIAGDAIDIVVDASAVPLLDGVTDLAAQGLVPGGTRTNLQHVNRSVTWTDQVPEVMKLILCDAQTSGGLVIGLPGARARRLADVLQRTGLVQAAIIGSVIPGGGKMTVVMETA